MTSIQQKFQVGLALNCFYVTILYGKYHTCGTQMPNIRDFGNGENIVPLHSEIGDVHRLAADVDYFFAKLNKLKQVYRARMLCKLHSEKEEGRPLPPPSPVGREPEGDKI